MGYGQFIKVHNVLHKDPVTCAVDEETRAEDIVIDLCKKLSIKPTARHLFSLCSHSSKEWVSPIVKLVNYESKVFDMRLRFKIPDFNKLRSIDFESYNFYFHQARTDLLSNNVPDISYVKNESELLGMGVADMYRVMLETGASRSAVESEYKKFIPKEVYNSHFIFLKNPMQRSLDSMIDRGAKQGHEAWFVKNQYLKQFENLAPSYLCEEYRASVDEGGVVKGVKIQVNPYDREFPGIKILYDGQKKWCHVCSIEDLCFITVRREDISVEIARKTGIPIYFSFSSLSKMFSFVCLLDGYYRLGVKWTFSLSKDLPTPSLERLHAIKCHGPVGGEFSYSKLQRLRSNKPGCYVLRESELAYEQYYLDVCTENSSKPTTYKIEKNKGGDGWSFNGEEKRYTTVQHLLFDLRSSQSPIKLVECLPPSEYDVTPLLLCRVDKDPYDKDDDEEGTSQTLLSVTQFIHPKELQLFNGKNKEHKGRISIVYRGIWHPEKRKRKTKKKVDIALKVFKSDGHHSIEDELKLMGQWASVQTPALVRLFGLTLDSPRGLVMELLPLGPLDVYLRQNARHLMEVDLVEAANYLATALWNLEEAGMVHGNIRCHKLMVAVRTESSFVVKLADPGLTRKYTDNDIHWLAPEFYPFFDNSVKSTASDVWAFGTTLWEIFSKGQQPTEKDLDGEKRQHAKDLRRMYLSGRLLKRPNGCSVDLYQLMLQCWTLDPHRRKKTQEALRDINRLLYQVFNSRRVHSYSVALPKGHHSKPADDSDHTTVTTDLSSDSGSSLATDFNPHWAENAWLLDTSHELSHFAESNSQELSTMFSHIDFSTASTSLDNVSSLQCIFELGADRNLVLQGIIGKGNFGVVFKGSLEPLDRNCEPQTVAVKRLVPNQIASSPEDFEREIYIMKRLKHENIVQIKFVINEPEVSLVMEYCPHGSLQCYLTINKDRLRPQHLLKFALDVAKGMEYLGKENIVHRDLAARNILVASDSHVKISDFGLARVMDNDNYYILKSCRYLPMKWYAPESLRDGKFSTRSDIWSYGVTLFEMFSFGDDPLLPSLKNDRTIPSELLALLEAGVRLPCPATCPQNIYVSLIHPCWLLESHSRPTFKAVIQLIEQLRSSL